MKKVLSNQSLLILIFLGIFGFSIGLFDNYREMWMSVNHLSTTSISRVISVSYIVTVFVLLFFTIRVSADKLKTGILITLVLKLITGTILICLNQRDQFFLIKFFMFFDIALTQLVVSSIYPLLMNIKKDDVLYTKKSTVESLSNKLGFLFISILLGRVIFGRIVDYNVCFFLSLLFVFFSFFVLTLVNVEAKEDSSFDFKKSIAYFHKNKIFLFFLLVSILGNVVWYSILGMPMLLFTQKFEMDSNLASFLILGFGILSNILAMVIVKYFKFSNDYVNLFFKFGIRVFFYLLIFLSGNKFFFFLGILYLLLTDCTHNFIFDSFFINIIDSNYSLILTTLKYCASLIGSSIGVFLCGLVFSMDLKYSILFPLLLGVLHYVLASILVQKKKRYLQSKV